MAENVIQQSDVAVENLYGHVIDSEKKFEEQTAKTNITLKAQADIFKELTEQSEQFTQKGLDKLMVARQKMNGLQKTAATTDKKSLEIQRKKISIDKKLLVEKEKLRQARLKETQQARRIIKLQQAEKNSVEALRAKLALVTNAWTKLTSAELKNTKRGKRLVNSKLKLTNQLKKLEKATGDNRREVGNYSLATDKLTRSLRGASRMLGQFGLALGGAALIRSTVSILSEFDEKLADIAKTTGETTKGAREISKELLNIDTRTSITNLQELASAAGRLGITGKDNIVGFAQAADKVFVALGDDLDGTAEEIATNLGKISSLFGLEQEFGIEGGIERVGSGLNELSANSKASAGNIQNFTNRMAGLSSILELKDVQALGALFDESGQSMEVASSTLNKLLPDLAKDFKRFAGVAGLAPEEFKKIAEEAPIEALKLVAEGAKSNEEGLFSLTDTLKSYGVESARATGIVGTLTNNIDRLGELQNIAGEAIRTNISITKEFNTKNQTLAATYDKAVNKLKAYILGSEGATKVSEGLKDMLGFLAENIETIMSVLFQLIKAFVLFKATMFALKMRENILNFKNFGRAAEDAGEGMSKGASSAKKFGAALKGIGISLAIGLLFELATAIRNVAEGYDDATDAAARFGKQTSIASKEAEQRAGERSNTLKENLRLAEKARDLALKSATTDAERNKITDEFLEKQKNLLTANKESIQSDINTVNARKEALKITLAENEAAKAQLLAPLGKLSATQKVAAAAILKQSDAWKKVNAAIRQNNADIGGANVRLTAYSEELKGVTASTNEATTAADLHAASVTATAAKAAGATKEMVSLLRDIEDEQIKQIDDQFKRKEVEAEVDARRRIEDLADVNATETEKAALTLEINKNLNAELEAIRAEKRAKELAEIRALEALLDSIEGDIVGALEDSPEDVLGTREAEFERAEKEKRLSLLKTKKTDEEIQEETTAFLIDQLKERIELYKLFGEDTIDLELELAELQRKNFVDNGKEFLAEVERQLQRGLDLAIENSKEKQRLLDEEIAKQKEVIANIRKGDAEGNAIADKSLALEEARLEERERMKREEAKQEALLEEIKMLWNSINSFLNQGDSFPVATAKGTAGTLGVKSLAKAIGSFFTGTKGRLGDEDKAVHGGRDGHLIWADKDEMIFNGGQVDQLEGAGIRTTEDATKSAILGAQLKGGLLSPKREQVPLQVLKMDALTKEMKGMRKDLAARPTQKLSPWIQNGILKGLEVYEKENSIEHKYLKPFEK